MNLIEIVPAHKWEHRRQIREMSREVYRTGNVPQNPAALAAAQIAATVVGWGAWIALCIAAAKWLLMM